MAEGYSLDPAGLPIKIAGEGGEPACEIERATEPCSIVIFGASGDLTERKLLPSLFCLFRNGLLPSEFLIIGAARSSMDETSFRGKIRIALKNGSRCFENERMVDQFLGHIYYQQTDYLDAESYKRLSTRLTELEREGIPDHNRIYYLSTPPEIYRKISENLGLSGLAGEETGWRRLVIEKPFGRDLKTAVTLNRGIKRHFREGQLFRIDHYLGKETVQDILMFRFANAIFEPLWNRLYIDHIQITAAESIGIGHRAGYYEQAGVIRDMFQNHMVQLLSLIAMEPPAVFEADSVRDEKLKVFKSIRPVPLDNIRDHLAMGQYAGGEREDGSLLPYREEEGVSPDSSTPTYAALKLLVDNWRWKDVPFYLRSGKRLKKRRTEIAVQFKHVPHFMFRDVMAGEIRPNRLVFTIQPGEGIKLTLQTKIPGTKVCLREVVMDFRYSDFYSGGGIDAYERVLIDCLSGDHTLFLRADGVEAAWKLFTPLLEAVESDPGLVPVELYPSGTEGPASGDALIEKDGRKWMKL